MLYAGDRNEVQSLLNSMFAGAGGSPGQPYTPPTGPNPNEPYVPAPKLASNVVGYEDWTIDGPVEQGPIPAVKDWNINHKGLKSLQKEIQDLKAKGLFL